MLYDVRLISEQLEAFFIIIICFDFDLTNKN